MNTISTVVMRICISTLLDVSTMLNGIGLLCLSARSPREDGLVAPAAEVGGSIPIFLPRIAAEYIKK